MSNGNDLIEGLETGTGCGCLSPLQLSDNYNDYYIDDIASFSGSGISGGAAPGYSSDDVVSPLFTFKTAKSLYDEATSWEVSFLKDSESESNDEIDKISEDSHCFTFYEYYTSVEAIFVFNDNLAPWTNFTQCPAEGEEIVEPETVTFLWEGNDDQTDPGSIRYKYRLDPYDTDWRPGQDYWTLSTGAVYKNLPPGDYTFRVRAIDNATNIETIKTLNNTRSFTILPKSQFVDDFPANSVSVPVSADYPVSYTHLTLPTN